MLIKFTSTTLNNVLLHLYLSVCLRVCASVPVTQQPVLRPGQHPAKQSDRPPNRKCHTDSSNASRIAPAQC